MFCDRSGFKPNSNTNTITAKIEIPEIEVIAKFKGKANVPVVGSIKPSGVITIHLSTYLLLFFAHRARLFFIVQVNLTKKKQIDFYSFISWC